VKGMAVKRIRTIFCAIVFSSVLAFSQDGDAPPVARALDADTPPAAARSLKVDVELVTVDVTVTDAGGRHVSGLDRQYFRVFEDKVEQKIEYFAVEDSPLTVGIIFDVSASMGNSLAKAKEAALTFLASGNREDEYFLVQFSDRPKLVQEFTSDLGRVKASLTAMSAKGATSLYDAVYLGLEKLRNARNPRKALLVISDGEDNRSRYSFSDLKHFAAEKDVKIYSIGISSGLGPPISNSLWGASLLGDFLFGPSQLEELASVTGGEAFFPQSLNRLDDICKRIAAGLKTQYSIGYRSTNLTKDGAWRKLNLKLESPNGLSRLNLRFKKGYYAATSGTFSR
jgi:Ca-activated chloride channel family protein